MNKLGSTYNLYKELGCALTFIVGTKYDPAR